MNNESHGDGPARDASQNPGPNAPPQPAKPKSEITSDANGKPKSDPAVAAELAREFKWFEVFSLAINAVLAVVGIVAVWIYGGQLNVMRGTLAEMQRSGQTTTSQMWAAIDNINWMAKSMDGSLKKLSEQAGDTRALAIAAGKQANAAVIQAKASNISAITAEKALRISEAPDIEFSGVVCETPPNQPWGPDTKIKIHFVNSGHGTAIHIRSLFAVGLPGQRVEVPTDQIRSMAAVGFGNPIETTPTKVGDNLTPQMIQLVQNNVVLLHMWGWVSYGDKFRMNHLLVYDLTYTPKTACEYRIVDIVGLP